MNIWQDSLRMDDIHRMAIKLLIPYMRIEDVVAAIEVFDEDGIANLAIQLPDRLVDRICTMCEPVELVFANETPPFTEAEAADLYSEGEPPDVDGLLASWMLK